MNGFEFPYLGCVRGQEDSFVNQEDGDVIADRVEYHLVFADESLFQGFLQRGSRFVLKFPFLDELIHRFELFFGQGNQFLVSFGAAEDGMPGGIHEMSVAGEIHPRQAKLQGALDLGVPALVLV